MRSNWSIPRRRTFLACNTCKSKKAKCDGTRPKCDRCAKAGADCVYTLNDRDKRLTHRNNWISHQKHQHGGPSNRIRPRGVSDSQDQLDAGMGDDVDETSFDTYEGTQILGLKPLVPRKEGEGASANSQLSESLADVLATNAFDQTSSGQVGYFGSSTNHGFFWCLSAAIANLGHKESRTQPSNLHQSHPVGEGERLARAAMERRASSRGNQQYPSNSELVARFFDTIGDILPYVDEQSVMAKLEVLNDHPGSPDASKQSWRALLNIILAYALYTLDGPSPEPYYRNVTNILYGTGIHLSTLQTLQALVLLSSFEQNIRRSMASLSSHALAVRTAYHLGIHAPSTYTHLGADERELRARLWLAIVTQDRILSACLGRPCLIATSHVRPEITKIASTRDISESELRGCSGSPITYFTELNFLHSITGLCLDNIYLSNISSVRDLSLQQLLTETLQRSLELDQWRAKSCFKIITADDTFSSRITATDSSDAFSVMISLHYHRISFLVHGAIVMRSLEYVSTTGPDFLAGIAGDTITSLLQRDLAAARDTHHIICDILQHRRGFLERTALWWICNYSAFTLSLHLFGLWIISSQIPSHRAESLGLQTPHIEELLQSALRNLRYMGKASLLSSKAHTRLRSLFDLLRDKESTISSTLSPQDTRDGLSDVSTTIPQGSAWVARQPGAIDAQNTNYEFPSLEEYGPDSLFGFLVSQDTIGFDYDFGNIVGDWSSI